MKPKISFGPMEMKPVVKYRKKGNLRYKLTLLETIKGPEAVALNEAQDKGSYWSYDAKKHIVEIYKEELL